MNPAYAAWEAQNQHFFIWLLNSISESIHARVVGCTHAWQLWDELHNYFNAQTKARSTQLQYELRHIVKEDRTISKYLLRIKALVDALISINNPVTYQEHFDAILEGLPDDYHLLFPTIESRIEPYSIAKIEALLLSHESRLERSKTKASSDVISINLTQGPPSNFAPNQVTSCSAPSVNSMPMNYGAFNSGNGY